MYKFTVKQAFAMRVYRGMIPGKAAVNEAGAPVFAG